MRQATKFQGPIDPDRLYPGPFVDFKLSINPSTRWRWVKRGILDPVYVAGIPRYRGNEILALCERRTSQSTADG